MDKALRYSIVSDGSSDRMLAEPLAWLLGQHAGPKFQYIPVDLGRVRRATNDLRARIRFTVDLSNCDLLFIHRDAEAQEPGLRVREVERASEVTDKPWVPVVPVRMTEAWFLFDADAIRSAAGNPAGTSALNLPRLRDLEGLADPKARLHTALRAAKGANGRRLKRFDVYIAQHLVARAIGDYTPLRAVPAFSALEADLRRLLRAKAWEKNS